MKVEVEVLQDFGDGIYGKKRTIGDKFVCDKELAIKRQKMVIKGKSLVKILRVVDDDTPEEEKVENPILEKIKMTMNKKNKENEEKGSEKNDVSRI